MCGLLVAVGAPGDAAVRARVDRALDTLAHRGPDGRGLREEADGVVLGHRRLAVLDPAGGAQPMVHPDTGVAVVFNGELYNHLALRPALAARGHRFRGTSDTETLLALYAEHGEGALAVLRGMYAFVIHDPVRRRLLGARDPFGKKPLYWSRALDGLAFACASEPRALLALQPGRRPTLSPDGLVAYLRHDYVTGALSAFQGIGRLLPGQAFQLALDDPAAPGAWRIWVHADPAAALGAPRDARPEAVLVDELEARLQGAVDRRLLADVPLGVLLSGGVDSTLVAALAVRGAGSIPVPSFAIGFDDPRFDESRYAREVAAAVGTVHHERRFGVEDVREAATRLIPALDEPFADPSLLPTSMLCAFAREHVTVALGGDGGDELFAGYDTFAAARAAVLASALVPRALDGALEAAAGWLPVDSARTHLPLEFKLRRFLRGYRLPLPARLATWMGPFDAPALDRLLPDLRWRDTAGATDPEPPAGVGDLDAMLHWYQRVYLPDDILVKGDRASMRHGLELRAPLLDVDLADFVNRLPIACKVHGGTRKRLLRRLLSRWGAAPATAPLRHPLPSHVLQRPKKGFGIPVATWLRGPLRRDLEETLLHHWPEPLALIDATARRQLVTEHLAGRRNAAKELWALLALAWWTRAWIAA